VDASTYIAYYFEVEPLNPGVEILIAELGFVGFESFVETPKGVTAFEVSRCIAFMVSEWNVAIC